MVRREGMEGREEMNPYLAMRKVWAMTQAIIARLSCARESNTRRTGGECQAVVGLRVEGRFVLRQFLRGRGVLGGSS